MIALSPEQQKEDQKKRIGEFTKDFKALEEKHQISLRALIQPEGPIPDLVDMKKYA